jgi:hypothetical protein
MRAKETCGKLMYHLLIHYRRNEDHTIFGFPALFNFPSNT